MSENQQSPAVPGRLCLVASRIGLPIACMLALLAIPLSSGRLEAQQAGAEVTGIAERMNASTVTIVTGRPSLSYSAFGNDLAAVLNDGDELRILPVVSQGPFQNVRDVRYLRAVDLGFAQTNILGHYRRSGEIADVSDRIVYIARISNKDIHVVARGDVSSLEQLRGLKVNFDIAGSGTQLSARDIFERVGVEVQELNMHASAGLAKLKAGEIAATVLTSGKPAEALAALKASNGYRILPVPFITPLQADYLSSTLAHDDYPDLIAPGQSVDTIASGTVLIAYNWPKNSDRYRRIDKFTKALFSKIADFQKPPHHAKWRDTDLAAVIPGWKRFEGADEWIKNHREQELARRRDQFNQYLTERQISPARARMISESDRNQLFEDFLKWSQSR